MKVTACIHRPAPQPRTFITGTALAWTTTVEKIKDVHMQVPCLILVDDNSPAVHVLSLRTATTWTTIEKLP
jgi:hypothetical protein